MRLAPLLLIGLAACKPPVDDVIIDDDPVWTEFTDSREGWLYDLAVPIEDCVGLVDTGHPAFHGCIDWHSHVHATWSLLAITRITGDPHFADVAAETLVEDDIAAELEDLIDGGITPNEVPYGYAWFLALARERDRAGQTDLEPLADEIADQLELHASSLTPNQLALVARSDNYTNLSWELLNLWLWSEHTGDTDRSAWVEDFVRNEIVPAEDNCPLDTANDRTYDFFPPCLHRARLILTVLPEDEAQDWLSAALPADFEVTPFPPDDAHTAGLNFSRTWGLWSLWQGSGDLAIRDQYIDHLTTHMATPEYWAEDYMAHSHWVAQFGVYGISLSYGEDP